MKLTVIYRPNSEYARTVETFIGDFNRLHEGLRDQVEVLNVDSREGMAMMGLYDIMDQPALIVQAEDGRQLNSWSGPQLPLMDEVAAYFYTSQS